MEYLHNLPLAADREAPSDEPCISIDDVCIAADNGDIILFSGESQISMFVTLFCGSQWSHIGIVYRLNRKSEPMLFESVKSDDDPTKPVGVRLMLLREVLMNFKGRSMALRCLGLPMEITLRDKSVVMRWRDHLFECMHECVRLHKGKKYEDRILNFIFARFTSLTIHYETRDRLFCSELVAICYQTMGILPAHHSCIQFIPDDFCEAGKVLLHLPVFIDFTTISRVPVRLGPQMFIRPH